MIIFRMTKLSLWIFADPNLKASDAASVAAPAGSGDRPAAAGIPMSMESSSPPSQVDDWMMPAAANEFDTGPAQPDMMGPEMGALGGGLEVQGQLGGGLEFHGQLGGGGLEFQWALGSGGGGGGFAAHKPPPQPQEAWLEALSRPGLKRPRAPAVDAAALPPDSVRAEVAARQAAKIEALRRAQSVRGEPPLELPERRGDEEGDEYGGAIEREEQRLCDDEAKFMATVKRLRQEERGIVVLPDKLKEVIRLQRAALTAKHAAMSGSSLVADGSAAMGAEEEGEEAAIQGSPSAYEGDGGAPAVVQVKSARFRGPLGALPV